MRARYAISYERKSITRVPHAEASRPRYSSAANAHGYEATLAPMGTSREVQVLLSRIMCTRVYPRGIVYSTFY